MTRVRWGLALCVGLVLVATAAAVPGSSAGTARDAAAGGIPTGATADGVDPERVVMEVDLRVDGSARWTIEHRVRLDDPNVTRGFERARERLRRNRSAFRDPFEGRVRAMAAEAEERTGRVMVVENVSIEARRERIPQEYGVITYRFRWYGFAATDERLRVDKVLSGLFLDEETRLLMSWPGNASLADVTPEPDERREGAVVWTGPLEFAPEEPRLVARSESATFGPDLSFDAGGDDLFVSLALLGVVLGGVGAAVTAWRRRRTGADGTAAEPTTDADEADGTAADTTAADDEPAADAADAPSELLSNEERVLALLEAEGGRMKQQDVVSTLGWSETKTSEVVSDLREAEGIEVYRLGRENVLALPDTGLGLESGGDEE